MMKTYLGIIPRNLIKNKKRTFALAISIVLAVMLITSVEILVRGIVNDSVRSCESDGKFHALYMNIYNNNIKKLKQDDRIDKIGIITSLGNSVIGNSTISVNGIDEGAIDLLSFKLVKGNYPKNAEDILIEDTVYNKLFVDKKIGDRIELTVGLKSLNLKTHMYEINKENYEFVLCGIVHNPSASIATEAGKVFLNQKFAENIIKPEQMIYNMYFTIKKDLPLRDTIENFNERYEKINRGIDERDYLKQYMFRDSFIDMLELYNNSKKVVIIIDIIIALAAAILIYNIFNISIAERIRHFGLLRSIGITPIQIRVIVFGEAVLLGIIFIPIGIVLGVRITYLLMSLIGGIGVRKIVVDSTTYNLATITISAFVSIIAASYKPANAASSVSPLEAMKSSNEVLEKEERDEKLIERLIKNIFGHTGKMAYMNILRNRKRFIAIVVSIAMGVMIFISVNYFISSIDPIKEAKAKKECDYVLSINAVEENIGFADEQINEVKSIQGVKEVNKYKIMPGLIYFTPDKITEKGIKKVQSDANPNIRKRAESGIYPVYVCIIGCSREKIDSIREKFNSDDNNASENKPEIYIVDKEKKNKITNLKPGEKIKVHCNVNNIGYKNYNNEFGVQAIIDETPFKLEEYADTLILLTEEENLSKLFHFAGYQRVSINVEKNVDVKSIEDKLNNIASRQKYGELSSFKEDLENIKKVKYQMIVILYGLFAIVLLFAIVNIINTISMNIITRKQEFGMLRAIGMTKPQLKQMIIKEGLIYGIVGSILGAIPGTLLTYIIFKFTNGTIFTDIKWVIEYGAIALVFIVTSILTIIATLIPLRRATSMNVVEAVRAIE